jgi:hypothetical protein
VHCCCSSERAGSRQGQGQHHHLYQQYTALVQVMQAQRPELNVVMVFLSAPLQICTSQPKSREMLPFYQPTGGDRPFTQLTLRLQDMHQRVGTSRILSPYPIVLLV